MNEHALPPKLERRVLEILDGPEEGWDLGFDRLCGDHPEHADRIRSRRRRMLELELDLDGDALGRRADPPREIGPFRVLRALGEGGMGTVYLCEQGAPIRRRVALKVIKAGMDTKQVLLRFEAERQALALMSHRSVARVFEAGTTESGRPWFAMELVEGAPITDYCDSHRLGIRERLELFREVCAGVQHAHQKGLIHRDLKPSNVLVTEEDGRPVPKIIDFGLARAVDRRLTDESLATKEGAFVGTPEYMSPEQFEGSGVDVDTRTDVYALGVVAYELLVGALPIESLRDAGFGPADLQRRVREQEPKKPSTRVTERGDHGAEAARERGVGVHQLAGQLRGDLDWIVLKALEKERERRYQTVGELAADVERYLRHDPVVARPASMAYRIRKLVRRHRLPVAAAAAVLASLIAGLVVSTSLYFEAEARAGQAHAVTDFLVGMFEQANREDRFSADTPIHVVLEAGSRGIRDRLIEHPAIRHELLDSLGRVQRGIGDYDAAEELHTQAIEVARRSGDRVAGLRSRRRLADVLVDRDRHGEAEQLLRGLIADATAELGARDRLVASCRQSLAAALTGQSRFADAERECRLAIGSYAALGAEWDVALARVQLSTILRNRTKFDAALGECDAALEAFERLRPGSHRDTLLALIGRANALILLDRIDEALAEADRALAMSERIHGPEHPVVASILQQHARALQANDRFEEVITTLRRALDITRTSHGPFHPDVARLLDDVAFAQRNLSRFDDEHESLSRAHEIWNASGVGDVQGRAVHLGTFAASWARLGDLERALELAEEAVAMQRRIASEEPSQGLGNSLGALAFVRMQRREYDEAVAVYEECLAVLEGVPDSGYFRATLLSDMTVCLLRKKDFIGAARAGQRAVAGLRAARPAGSRLEAVTMHNVGEAFYRQKNLEQAEAWYRKSVDLFRELPSDQEREIVMPLFMLALLAERRDKADAVSLWEELVAIRSRLDPPQNLWRIIARVRLGRTLHAIGEHERAEPILLDCYALLLEHHGAENPNTVAVRQGLAALYESWSKPEKAAEYTDK